MAIVELNDLFKEVIGDIYAAWREILALCGIAVGMYSHISCCYFWQFINEILSSLFCTVFLIVGCSYPIDQLKLHTCFIAVML